MCDLVIRSSLFWGLMFRFCEESVGKDLEIIDESCLNQVFYNIDVLNCKYFFVYELKNCLCGIFQDIYERK